MYEGSPDWPDKDRYWEHRGEVRDQCALHLPHHDPHLHALGGRISQAARPESRDCSGTVGEPINPEAWMWYHETHRARTLSDRGYVVADRDRDDHDLPAAGRRPTTKPGSVTLPLPGVGAEIVDENGHRLPPTSGAIWCSTRPWPGMLRTFWEIRTGMSRRIGVGSRQVLHGGRRAGWTRMVLRHRGGWGRCRRCRRTPSVQHRD